ncbi:MAG: hypothetical protein GEU78_09555 [Actinobacteria bacterium]|nr:hypothetical protein [Actinomycetota bacterium]
MTIKRVDRGKNHWYVDTETGDRVPGVTTITDGGLPKKALINWAANATAEAAIDRWDELAELTPSVRLKTLQGARYAVKDAAAKQGTKVHNLAEKLVHGERVTVPDEIAGHVQSYTRFLDEFDVRPILVEKTVHSATHNYCGTFDLIADLLNPDDPEPDPEQRNRITALLDLKTNRSGIFGETALQLAGYRYADMWVDDDGNEYEIPEVDMCGAVHVRTDGYSLIPLEVTPLQHRQFLYVQQVAQFDQTSRELVGEPIEPPYASTYRLVREDT